ncbi:glycine/D-amino acid oxidase-like deaminating enzyme [Diaminobutyricimonas aerilata]|uniref:Glycine/D-amino acid oxidase-like deaminating enzyme n=1 Tax=Diaminobutyricimonas aerilata TaxID=1162967 RepID=A0A2M9CL68_9MICO|nr:FAD-dependent oxidoreductase [Diaminobutyricimonas aerilata]PJJ72643.1 glycine/D-amino acid oxidase-like deaminating enzyme [Diaminobutyricimonas aerilata]
MTSLWLDRAPNIETDEFEADAHYDEVVVGAGLTGLVAALLLARAGRRVVVLESRRVGALTTGNTTAKLSVLQGSQLQKIKHRTYQAVLDAYVEANLEGQAWLLRYADEHGIPVQRRDAISYATTVEGAATIDREYEAARSTGLPVVRSGDAGLPFETTASVRLADQAQFDPMDVLRALVLDLRAHGGKVVENVRVTGARASDPVEVRTTRGEVRAGHLIVATGMPILDRGLYWAKLRPKRSYGLSFRVPGDIPSDMYVSVDGPTRSLRTTPDESGELLLVGGNGHEVGRHPSPASLVDDLVDWTERWFPGAERTHTWSAQDYETPHGVPFVGWMPRGRGRIFLATGYDKWGMTNAVQCGLTLASDILGGHQPWAKTLHRRVTTPRAMAVGLGMNAAVAWEYLKGWTAAVAKPLPDQPPAEGQGEIGRDGLKATAISTVDGVTCKVSALCPHLHAMVAWNDQERTWDCPAHGSRFAADGTRLEGPTVRDLAAR